jgi:hypothetical protein
MRLGASYGSMTDEYQTDVYFDWKDNENFINDVLFIVRYPTLPKLWTTIYIAWNDHNEKVFESDTFLKRDECRAMFYELLKDKKNFEFFNEQRLSDELKLFIP